MRPESILKGGIVCLLLAIAGLLHAQNLSPAAPSAADTNSVGGVAPAAPVANAATSTPVAPDTTAKTATDDSADMTASDFLIDGVPTAKVLYMEGNVWIRTPTEMSFHLLTDTEPIPAMSVLYTGVNGVLDLATGPGMAVRMVPMTLIRVAVLPQASTAAAPAPASPESCRIGLRTGTIFSALGREDQSPLDYEVRTPQGVAGARGTMFATSISGGNTQVSMLHGTVHFETPDHQTSQITAGQSQRISAGLGGKYQLGPSEKLNPARSEEFFNHAGGLLEHASGSGVVRRGLGPDVARTLHEHGYNLPAHTEQRFQNAGKVHYTPRSAFHGTHGPRTTGAEEKTYGTTRVNTRPGTEPVSHQVSSSNKHLTPAEEKNQNRTENQRTERRHPAENDNKDKRKGWGL